MAGRRGDALAGLDAMLRRVLNRLDIVRLGKHVSVMPCKGLVHLGTEYGGYFLPEDLPHADWVCYSGGIGEDVSFERELISRYGCTVVGFDPTPRSIDFMRAVKLETSTFRFLPVGLWSIDTEQRFYAPENPEHVSHSIAGRARSDEYFTAQCRSVPSLMAELGHARIDLLKLDIEGAEYEVLTSMLDAEITVKILLVEFHRTGSFGQMRSMVDRIQAAGYAPVHVDHTNVTFVEAGLL